LAWKADDMGGDLTLTDWNSLEWGGWKVLSIEVGLTSDPFKKEGKGKRGLAARQSKKREEESIKSSRATNARRPKTEIISVIKEGLTRSCPISHK